MRSSKSTCVRPGACSGRSQRCLGSISSGRACVGFSPFLPFAILPPRARILAFSPATAGSSGFSLLGQAALLVFLPAAAGARVVAADLGRGAEVGKRVRVEEPIVIDVGYVVFVFFRVFPSPALLARGDGFGPVETPRIVAPAP